MIRPIEPIFAYPFTIKSCATVTLMKIDFMWHGLQTIANFPIARQGSRILFDLRLDSSEKFNALLFGLMRENCVSLLKYFAEYNESTKVLTVNSEFDQIRSGMHELVVLNRNNLHSAHKLGLQIFVTSGSLPYVLLDALPSCLQIKKQNNSLNITKAKTRLNIDSVISIIPDDELLSDSISQERGVVLRIRGWCFAHSFGKPQHAVAQWREGAAERFVIVETFHRQDVAIHLSDSNALPSGFDIEIPLISLIENSLKFTLFNHNGQVLVENFVKSVNKHVIMNSRNDFILRGLAGRLTSPRHLWGRVIDGFIKEIKIMQMPIWKASRQRILQSKIFDVEFYKSQTSFMIDPIAHYFAIGANMGLNPHPLFDTNWYIANNTEIIVSKINPLVHFIDNAHLIFSNPSPLFCSKWYVNQHAEIQQLKIHPFIYYLRIGAARGDLTTPYFDPRWYQDTTGISIPENEIFTYFVAHDARSNCLLSPFYRLVHRPVGRVERRAEESSLANCTEHDHEQLSVKRVAVIAHICFLDLFSEIRSYLNNMKIPFDLYLTCPADRFDQVSSLASKMFSDAKVTVTSNLSGDMIPFFEVLSSPGFFDSYSYVCKIHTQRGDIDPSTWRKVLLQSVLGSKELVFDIIDAFEKYPNLDVVGSRELYLSGKSLSAETLLIVKLISDHMVASEKIPEEWGFFAGSMFWARCDYLRNLLKRLNIILQSDTESYGKSGWLEQALERLIGLSVALEKSDIGLVDAVESSDVSFSLRIHHSPACPKQENLSTYLSRQRSLDQNMWS